MQEKKLSKKDIYTLLIKQYFPTFINLILTNGIDILIGIMIPLLFKILIDVAFYNKNLTLFFRIILGIFILFICRMIIFIIMDLSWNFMCRKFQYSIAEMTLKKVIRLKYNDFLKFRIGDFIQRINYDSYQFWNLFYWSGVYLVVPLSYFIVASIILFIIDYKISIVVIIVITLTVFLSNKLGNKLKIMRTSLANCNAGYVSWIYDIFRGVREIYLSLGHTFIERRFVSKTEDIVKKQIDLTKQEFKIERINSSLILFSKLIIYVICTLSIFYSNLTIGKFIAIIEYVDIIQNNLNELLCFILEYKKNSFEAERVLEILNMNEESDSFGKLQFSEKVNKIELRKVFFSYDNNHSIIKNISLNISKGEKVAFVGKSGVGKSTLINILIGFLIADQGEYLINNVNVRDISLESLRDYIGIVFQEPYLFRGTIRTNLEMGEMKLEDDYLHEICKKANIDNYIKSLECGFDTIIENPELEMSRGQRQRLVIARVLAKNPQILIFDECTASLDGESENAIHDTISELSKDHICIYVTHRLATVFNVDKVAVINDGQIQAYGAYENIKDLDIFKDIFLS